MTSISDVFKICYFFNAVIRTILQGDVTKIDLDS